MTAKPRVLVAAPLVGDHVARLADRFQVETTDAPFGLTGEQLRARIANVDAAIVLLSHRVDDALLAAAPRLRVVGNHAVGVDNIDLEACKRRNVTVVNTPGVLTEATADLAFGLLLDACRRITEGDRLVRAGGFVGWTPSFHLGKRVTGATLGIVGFGRIGRAVAERALGFSMRVIYAAPRRAAPEVEASLRAEHVPLDRLLATSDVVSLHVPATETTRGMLSAAAIRSMKRGAVLVNTARGALVDEAALADALVDGHLGGAGLDVYAEEPRIHPRLLAAPRVVLAPHIGSADEPTRSAMAALVCEGITDVLEGRAPRHRVA